MDRIASRVGVLTGTATAVLVGLAAPALADITISPNTAEPGAGVNGDFTVTNDSPSTAITKVTLTLPVDRPIAEVYPLSAEDWAPSLTNRKLNPPMPSFHGTLLDQATATVTWTAMPGKALAPGKTAHLRVAMGPMPDADHIVFTLQPTYADGSTGPATAGNGATRSGATRVAMKLTPAAGSVSDEQLADLPPAAEDEGGGFWSVAGWIAAAIFAGFGIVATLRARRERHGSADQPAVTHGEASATEKTDQDDDSTGEPVAAGPRVTSWSYRDGP